MDKTGNVCKEQQSTQFQPTSFVEFHIANIFYQEIFSYPNQLKCRQKLHNFRDFFIEFPEPLFL